MCGTPSRDGPPCSVGSCNSSLTLGTSATATTCCHREADVTPPNILDVLEPAQNEGYGGRKLPCTRDEEIAHVVEALSRGRATDEDLGPPHAHVLGVFAERMATLARRQGSPSDLKLGLEALALAERLGDSREALLVMPLLWKTAEVLALNPTSEFVQVAERHGVKELRAFVERRPEDRSVESMGYVETYDESGFIYDRTW